MHVKKWAEYRIATPRPAGLSKNMQRLWASHNDDCGESGVSVTFQFGRTIGLDLIILHPSDGSLLGSRITNGRPEECSTKKNVVNRINPNNDSYPKSRWQCNNAIMLPTGRVPAPGYTNWVSLVRFIGDALQCTKTPEASEWLTDAPIYFFNWHWSHYYCTFFYLRFVVHILSHSSSETSPYRHAMDSLSPKQVTVSVAQCLTSDGSVLLASSSQYLALSLCLYRHVADRALRRAKPSSLIVTRLQRTSKTEATGGERCRYFRMEFSFLCSGPVWR